MLIIDVLDESSDHHFGFGEIWLQTPNINCERFIPRKVSPSRFTKRRRNKTNIPTSQSNQKHHTSQIYSLPSQEVSQNCLIFLKILAQKKPSRKPEHFVRLSSKSVGFLRFLGSAAPLAPKVSRSKSSNRARRAASLGRRTS